MSHDGQHEILPFLLHICFRSEGIGHKSPCKLIHQWTSFRLRLCGRVPLYLCFPPCLLRSKFPTLNLCNCWVIGSNCRSVFIVYRCAHFCLTLKKSMLMVFMSRVIWVYCNDLSFFLTIQIGSIITLCAETTGVYNCTNAYNLILFIQSVLQISLYKWSNTAGLTAFSSICWIINKNEHWEANKIMEIKENRNTSLLIGLWQLETSCSYLEEEPSVKKNALIRLFVSKRVGHFLVSWLM